MPAPNAPTGARSRRENERDSGNGDRRNPAGNNQGQKASTPDISPENRRKGRRAQNGTGTILDIEALNPPFDPRMRRIGSPLNLTSKIRRGWIQSEDGADRVNFLFNPPSVQVTNSIDSSVVPNPKQGFKADSVSPFYASVGASTGVTLLYDRTYELFSPPKSGEQGFASKYGVWADVAAWYTYLKMFDEMPTSWEDSMITAPAQYRLSYLFIGPLMGFYGWVTNIDVTYSHWSQNMVPARCAVNLGFMILPHSGTVPGRGTTLSPVTDVLEGWAQNFADGFVGTGLGSGPAPGDDGFIGPVLGPLPGPGDR